MNLIWGKYIKDQNRYFLLIELARDDSMVYCINTDGLPDPLAVKFRENHARIDALDMPQKIEWIKAEMPQAMKNYRTIYLSNLYIISTYKIRSSHEGLHAQPSKPSSDQDV